MTDGGALLYPATMQSIDTAHSPSGPALYQQDLPNSQDSYVSAVSSISSGAQLPSTSSNFSVTTGGTNLTPPPSTKISPVQGHAPLRIDPVSAPRSNEGAASPLSLESPMAQGFKRTADGTVKGTASATEAPAPAAVAPVRAHKRTKSGETSRIGELSAQLKTRLSYAMIKVQNGWENQSLEELEERASQQGSPASIAGRTNGPRLTFHSPTAAERRRLSENSDQMLISPGQSTPPGTSQSLAATPSSYWRPTTKPAMTAAVNLISVTGSDRGPMLGPAADLSAPRKRRSSASFHPPPLLGSDQRKHYSDLGSMPRTPATPRAGILRMPSQQAEKDAVDTLLFMSSPNNSGRVQHTSLEAQTQRTIAVPRRVMFEGHPAPGKSANYHHSPIASNQSSAYYRAEPPR